MSTTHRYSFVPDADPPAAQTSSSALVAACRSPAAVVVGVIVVITLTVQVAVTLVVQSLYSRPAGQRDRLQYENAVLRAAALRLKARVKDEQARAEQLNEERRGFQAAYKNERVKLAKALKREHRLKLRQGHLCGLPLAYTLANINASQQAQGEWLISCDNVTGTDRRPSRGKHGSCASARASGGLRIPMRIAQTGPPDPRRWSPVFVDSYGSWQRHHPQWAYEFWNDTDSLSVANPNYEPFVARHAPWFLPAWRQLCNFVMKLDVARYLWLCGPPPRPRRSNSQCSRFQQPACAVHTTEATAWWVVRRRYVHGGVYSDLDVNATADMTPWLREADVVLPANSRAAHSLANCILIAC